ncbi:MAG: hypothetical protein JNL18_17015 [Planctomycetaceae bacterium]|nr:hypothetical protein [Planctomycetaceae bacterium]
MRSSEIKLLSLGEGHAVASTHDRFRIIKMPGEQIVGELADPMVAIGQVTRDGYGLHGAWKIAMSYELCRIVEAKSIALNDIAIQPIGKGCCPWCGAHGLEYDDPTEFECGTFLEAGWDQAGYSEDFARSYECEESERCRHEEMVSKSAVLRELLADAGIKVENAGDLWLLDGRPSGGQFLKSTRKVRRRLGDVGQRHISRSTTRTSSEN